MVTDWTSFHLNILPSLPPHRSEKGGARRYNSLSWYLGLQSATLVELTGYYMYIIKVRAQTRKSHKIPRLGWCKGRPLKVGSQGFLISRGSWFSSQFWPELHADTTGTLRIQYAERLLSDHTKFGQQGVLQPRDYISILKLQACMRVYLEVSGSHLTSVNTGSSL